MDYRFKKWLKIGGKFTSLAFLSLAAMQLFPIEAFADDPFENFVDKGQEGLEFLVTKATILGGSVYLFTVIWGVKAGTKQWSDVIKVLIGIIALSSVIAIAEFLVGTTL